MADEVPQERIYQTRPADVPLEEATDQPSCSGTQSLGRNNNPGRVAGHYSGRNIRAGYPVDADREYVKCMNCDEVLMYFPSFERDRQNSAVHRRCAGPLRNVLMCTSENRGRYAGPLRKDFQCTSSCGHCCFHRSVPHIETTVPNVSGPCQRISMDIERNNINPPESALSCLNRIEAGVAAHANSRNISLTIRWPFNYELVYKLLSYATGVPASVFERILTPFTSMFSTLKFLYDVWVFMKTVAQYSFDDYVFKDFLPLGHITFQGSTIEINNPDEAGKNNPLGSEAGAGPCEHRKKCSKSIPSENVGRVVNPEGSVELAPIQSGGNSSPNTTNMLTQPIIIDASKITKNCETQTDGQLAESTIKYSVCKNIGEHSGMESNRENLSQESCSSGTLKADLLPGAVKQESEKSVSQRIAADNDDNSKTADQNGESFKNKECNEQEKHLQSDKTQRKLSQEGRTASPLGMLMSMLPNKDMINMLSPENKPKHKHAKTSISSSLQSLPTSPIPEKVLRESVSNEIKQEEDVRKNKLDEEGRTASPLGMLMSMLPNEDMINMISPENKPRHKHAKTSISSSLHSLPTSPVPEKVLRESVSNEIKQGEDVIAERKNKLDEQGRTASPLGMLMSMLPNKDMINMLSPENKHKHAKTSISSSLHSLPTSPIPEKVLRESLSNEIKQGEDVIAERKNNLNEEGRTASPLGMLMSMLPNKDMTNMLSPEKKLKSKHAKTSIPSSLHSLHDSPIPEKVLRESISNEMKQEENISAERMSKPHEEGRPANPLAMLLSLNPDKDALTKFLSKGKTESMRTSNSLESLVSDENQAIFVTDQSLSLMGRRTDVLRSGQGTTLAVQITDYMYHEETELVEEVIPADYKWTKRNKFRKKKLPRHLRRIKSNPKFSPKLMPIYSDSDSDAPTSDKNVTAESKLVEGEYKDIISLDLFNSWKQDIGVALKLEKDIPGNRLIMEQNTVKPNGNNLGIELKEENNDEVVKSLDGLEKEESETNFYALRTEIPSSSAPNLALRPVKVRNVFVLNELKKRK